MTVPEIKEKQAENKTYLPVPCEVTSENSGYQYVLPYTEPGQTESLVGSPSDMSRVPPEVMAGFMLDVNRNWWCIQDRLERNGFHINLDDCSVVKIAPPEYPKGIQPDSNQLIYQPLHKFGAEVRRQLIGVLADDRDVFCNPYQVEITRGLYNPDNNLFKLKALAEQVKLWTDPDKREGEINYRGEVGKATRAMIPRADQFCEQIRKLSFGDIFTIFQGSELERFKLALGRSCVGQTGSIDPFTGEKLIHTYRLINVIDGQFAGQGKSTLMRYLIDALRMVGFNIADSAPPLNSRFNLAGPLGSDILFRDDTTTDDLAKEVATSLAKIMATGGTVATEEKGKDAESTRCTAAVICLANRLDQRFFWGLDDGSRSRVSIIETVPEGSIPSNKLPLEWIPSLSKELGVDTEAIMLWACRLAVDEFLKYTGNNAYDLEDRCKSLESAGNKTNADPLDGILASIVIGYKLANPDKSVPRKINTNILAEALLVMARLKQDEHYQAVSVALLDTLDTLDGHLVVPAWHPVQGLKRVDPASIQLAYDIAANQSRAVNPNEKIKLIFSSLSLEDGNQCQGSPGTIRPRFNSLVSNEFTFNRLMSLYDKIKHAVPSTKPMMPTTVDYSTDLFWNL